MYFLRKYKDRMIVILITVILLVVIGKTSSERENITLFEKTIGNILSPVSGITLSIGNGIGEFSSSIKNYFNVKDENLELKEQLRILESENRDLENVIGMSDFLKSEAEILINTQRDILKSKITSKESGNWFNRFTIDKGSKDGVIKGATIVTGVETETDYFQEGIVGRVIDVGDNWSKVVSITDDKNSISFKAIRTQDGGVLHGSVDGTISGYLFDNKADIIVGDKLYTTDMGGSYVNNIYIGQVSEVFTDDKELTKRIVIEPAVNFNKLYRVLVIIK